MKLVGNVSTLAHFLPPVSKVVVGCCSRCCCVSRAVLVMEDGSLIKICSASIVAVSISRFISSCGISCCILSISGIYLFSSSVVLDSLALGILWLLGDELHKNMLLKGEGDDYKTCCICWAVFVLITSSCMLFDNVSIVDHSLSLSMLIVVLIGISGMLCMIRCT